MFQIIGIKSSQGCVYLRANDSRCALSKLLNIMGDKRQIVEEKRVNSYQMEFRLEDGWWIRVYDSPCHITTDV